jgi:hypothetical protein
MTRQRTNKPGSLGPAFHTWLEWLEHIEYVMLGTGPMKGKPKYIAMNDALFQQKDDDAFKEMMNECMPVDAYNARVVRSSTKYKLDVTVIVEMVQKYKAELEYIRNTRPLNLPFEWCTLVITGYGDDDILVCMTETEPRDGGGYPELNIEADEKFIDCSIAFYRPTGVEMMDGTVHKSQRLSYCPVELHFNKGLLEQDSVFLHAVAKGVTVTPRGKEVIDLVRTMILIWMSSFHLSSMLRHKRIGLPPAHGNRIKRKRLRKKKDHPHFEHFIVEMEVDEPDPMQDGVSMYQPRKRLHQVRGFFRHYQSGKVSWVKAHWRGDENLGVVKKDYELTLHEEHNHG